MTVEGWVVLTLGAVLTGTRPSGTRVVTIPSFRRPTALLMNALATPWSRVEGKFQVNLPQLPPLRGGICMGVDLKKHPFAPGLPPGRLKAACPI